MPGRPLQRGSSQHGSWHHHSEQAKKSRERRAGQKHSLGNLISGVTSGHFYHVPFSRRKLLGQPYTQGDGLTQGHDCQESGSTGDHFRIVLPHAPTHPPKPAPPQTQPSAPKGHMTWAFSPAHSFPQFPFMPRLQGEWGVGGAGGWGRDQQPQQQMGA